MGRIDSMRWRPSSVCLLLLLAWLLAAEPARAADTTCLFRLGGTIPAPSWSSCGFTDNNALIGYDHMLYYDQKCSNPTCMAGYKEFQSLNPSECRMDDDFGAFLLYAEILAPLYAACAARTASPPPVATTPLPTTAATLSPVVPSPEANESAVSSSGASGASAAPDLVSTGAINGSTTSPEADPTPPSTVAPASAVATPGDGSRGRSKLTLPPAMAVASPADGAVDAQPGVNTSPNTSNNTRIEVGVAAALAVVVALVLAVWLWHTQRRRSKRLHDSGSSSEATSHDGSTSASSYSLIAPGDAGQLTTSTRKQIEQLFHGDHTLESWRISSDRLVTKRLLGRGGHAFVHLVALPDGTQLAAKRLAVNQLTLRHFSQLVAEVHIVSTLQHHCIVQFRGVAWTSPLDFQVLFEHVAGGDLRSYLDTNPRPSGSDSAWSPLKLQVALAIAEGLTYAHSFNPPLVHRDLNSRAILLTHDFQQAKLSGFGVSRFLSEDNTMTTGVGTNRWVAPDVLSGGGAYNERCDIYSLGVVLTELDTHDEPLAKEMAMMAAGSVESPQVRTEMWLLQEVVSGRLRPSLSASCPAEIRKIATRCLSFDPKDRPSPVEISYALRKIVGSV